MNYKKVSAMILNVLNEKVILKGYILNEDMKNDSLKLYESKEDMKEGNNFFIIKQNEISLN